MQMSSTGKALYAISMINMVIFAVIAIVFASRTPTYETGSEISERETTMTVHNTQKIDRGTGIDSGYYAVKLKYVYPEDMDIELTPEYFRLEDGNGALLPLKEVSKAWDDVINMYTRQRVWINSEPVTSSNDKLFLARVDSTDVNDVMYRIRLEPDTVYTYYLP